jgi:hypothetical protein
VKADGVTIGGVIHDLECSRYYLEWHGRLSVRSNAPRIALRSGFKSGGKLIRAINYPADHQLWGVERRPARRVKLL